MTSREQPACLPEYLGGTAYQVFCSEPMQLDLEFDEGSQHITQGHLLEPSAAQCDPVPDTTVAGSSVPMHLAPYHTLSPSSVDPGEPPIGQLREDHGGSHYSAPVLLEMLDRMSRQPGSSLDATTNRPASWPLAIDPIHTVHYGSAIMPRDVHPATHLGGGLGEGQFGRFIHSPHSLVLPTMHVGFAVPEAPTVEYVVANNVEDPHGARISLI
ncbi:hypothetical protein BC834DRAFT_609682 [Gloeopeniophorella convolvens]|nr:hypothetical protein BC834DRAFT_609682 [Gloeopeniophorella convolvens]